MSRDLGEGCDARDVRDVGRDVGLLRVGMAMAMMMAMEVFERRFLPWARS